MRLPTFSFGPTQRQHWLFAAKLLLALIVLIALLGFFAAPWAVKTYGADKLGAAIGRKLEFGEVRINPFTLSATLRNLTLYEADGQGKMLTVGEVYVNASAASLLQLAPVITEIRVEEPLARIVRSGESRFNFSDIVDKILAKPDTGEGAAQFSLNNIHLRGGRIDYDDQFRQSRHSLAEINLAIPFLSNLRRRVNIFTKPAFSARLDGSPFEISGKTRPFADNRDTALQIDLDGLALPEFMPLMPLPLHFKLGTGLLDARLNVDFHESAEGGSVVISGNASVRELQLQDPAGAPLLQWQKLTLELERAEPFNQLVRVTRLTLDAPQLHASRASDGSLNLLRAFTLPARTATAAANNKPAAEPAVAAKPFVFALNQAEIRNGQLHWQDAATGAATPLALHIKQLDASLSHFSTDGSQAAQLHATLETDAAETLRYDGTLAADGKALHGEAQITALQPQRLQPYFASVFGASLGPSLLDATLPHQLAWPASGLDLTLNQASADLRAVQLTLPHAKSPAVSATHIALSGIQLDLGKHRISADELAIAGAQVAVSRNAKGQIDLLTILAEAPSTPSTPSKAGKAAPASPPPAAGWQSELKRLTVKQAEIRFSDALVAVQNGGKPALQHLSKLDLQLENLSLPSSAGQAPAPLTLAATHNQRGSLAATGTLSLQPLGAKLQINGKQLDLTAFQPYFADRSNASISRGALNANGKLMLQVPEHAAQALKASYTGALSLTGVRTQDRLTGDDFLSWKSLSVGRIDAHLNTEKNPLVLALGNIALSDFFARIIVNPNGRLNLQDIVAHPGQAAPSVSLTQSTQTTPAPTPAATTGPEPLIRIGQITLQGGNINFSDNFIKPNYSANLTGMSGSISKVASDQQTPADVALNGKLDGDAPVEINGTLNPLGPQLFLDLAASAHGIELTRLTPYAAKYAGYPITKGKLSVDVKYHVENGKLDAQNKLFLDQLTFGDKVDSPDATKLPVLLAVALLRNSRGEIDVNLPVSGSLSDPEFSVGGVILKVIVNLLTKAITAPFSLLASAFGGGDELSYIQFAPGSSALTAAASQKLETLAKALNDRPALQLDITGRVDPDSDRDGVRRAYVERKVKQQKAEDLHDDGGAARLAEITVEPSEYPKYLERAYKAEKFSKPRNLIGLPKSLPPAEMEQLMLANAPAGDEELKALADRRAMAVKQALEQQGKVASDRMFLIAPKLSAAGIKDDGKPNRVEFAVKH